MKCLDSSSHNIGQTRKTCSIRYKEHMQAICSNNSNSSGYLNHMANIWNIRGTITNIMEVIRAKKWENISTV